MLVIIQALLPDGVVATHPMWFDEEPDLRLCAPRLREICASKGETYLQSVVIRFPPGIQEVCDRLHERWDARFRQLSAFCFARGYARGRSGCPLHADPLPCGAYEPVRQKIVAGDVDAAVVLSVVEFSGYLRGKKDAG